MSKAILGIIPARYNSTRLPGKPLAIINGKPMIEHVYHRAVASDVFTDVIVATDDMRIANAVSDFRGRFMLTRHDHPSGTDRCAEVLEQLNGKWDAVINIQGDEPFIQKEQIALLASAFADEKTEIATLVKLIDDNGELLNPGIPKVVLNKFNNAMYFSRSVIPFLKNVDKHEWQHKHAFYKHIGIYGYRTDILPYLTKLMQTPLEIAESLEQLRWLENGYSIRCMITLLDTLSIDTPEDLEKAQLLSNF